MEEPGKLARSGAASLTTRVHSQSWSTIFHTMQRIGTVGENPFEGSANDVPISTIARGIEIDLREMLGESQEQIPQPLPTLHHVQM